MNDEMTTPAVIDAPAETLGGGAAPESATAAAAKAVQGVAGELKSLGQQLAAVLRAAAGTPEAEQFGTQVREGLGSLRDEIDDALEGMRSGSRRAAGDQATHVLSRAQAELANALRVLGRGLDRLASSVEPSEGGAATNDGRPPAPADGPGEGGAS